jgi:type I restriction enzyme R subunit
MQKIYSSRAWTGAQLGWLKRFEKQLRLEVILDGEALNGGQFQTEGGFARINKIFAGQAEQVLSEIHDEIWKDVA